MRLRTFLSVIFGILCGTQDTAPTEPKKSWKDFDEEARIEYLQEVVTSLAPLHEEIHEPGPSDWLSNNIEPGQTFQEYVHSRPIRAQGKRTSIYIQKIGAFTAKQSELVTLSARGISAYYGLPVKFLKDAESPQNWPDDTRRTHPEWGVHQLLSTYIMNDILKPALPEDAAVLLGFCAQDLWPGEGWNFVFGQASLRDRIGVWSIYRNGKADGSEDEFRLCLLRTLKTANHEIGHMFSMLHCTAYECNMCGSNHREESDRRPIAMCSQCLPKIAHATGVDLRERYKALSKFYGEIGLNTQRRRCESLLQALPK